MMNQKVTTSRNGFVFFVILYSNMQSSQDSLSELLIHFWRHAWCTNLRLPEHRHGATRGDSFWISQLSHWQIRHTSTFDKEESHLSADKGVGELGCNVSWNVQDWKLFSKTIELNWYNYMNSFGYSHVSCLKFETYIRIKKYMLRSGITKLLTPNVPFFIKIKRLIQTTLMYMAVSMYRYVVWYISHYCMLGDISCTLWHNIGMNPLITSLYDIIDITWHITFWPKAVT